MGSIDPPGALIRVLKGLGLEHLKIRCCGGSWWISGALSGPYVLEDCWGSLWVQKKSLLNPLRGLPSVSLVIFNLVFLLVLIGPKSFLEGL